MERKPLIELSYNLLQNIDYKWRCKDCKQLFNEDQIANIITPRSWSCHYILQLNLNITSCNIMKEN